MKTSSIIIGTAVGLTALAALALARHRVQSPESGPSIEGSGSGKVPPRQFTIGSKVPVDPVEAARERVAGRPADEASIRAHRFYNHGRFREAFAAAAQAIDLAQPWQRGLLVEARAGRRAAPSRNSASTGRPCPTWSGTTVWASRRRSTWTSRSAC